MQLYLGISELFLYLDSVAAIIFILNHIFGEVAFLMTVDAMHSSRTLYGASAAL